MSSASERLIEKKQERSDLHLANLLGITYSELLRVKPKIRDDGSDDGCVINHIIEFDNDAPREILDKIIGIEDGKRVWLAPWDLGNEDYYEEQYNVIITNKKFLSRFQESIANHQLLNEIELDDKRLDSILKSQIFIGIIGTLETFLTDTFINLTTDNDEYFRNFVETYPEFRQSKFELRNLYIEQDRIKVTGKRIMLDIIYHDLPKVKSMYELTFKIKFPSIGQIMQSINIRHHLVHRSGKTKDGDEIIINKAIVQDLIDKISGFVTELANELGISSNIDNWLTENFSNER
jgi:hypothetical protein